MGLWSFWLILVVGFLVAESFTMSTTCLYIALGALAAMIVALLGGGWAPTILSFVVATAILYLTTYRWRHKIIASLHRSASHAPTGMEALIGRTGKVILSDRPRVKIDGDTWEIRSHGNGTPLQSDQQVKVTGYDSIILLVEPLEIQS